MKYKLIKDKEGTIVDKNEERYKMVENMKFDKFIDKCTDIIYLLFMISFLVLIILGIIVVIGVIIS